MSLRELNRCNSAMGRVWKISTEFQVGRIDHKRPPPQKKLQNTPVMSSLHSRSTLLPTAENIRFSQPGVWEGEFFFHKAEAASRSQVH